MSKLVPWDRYVKRKQVDVASFLSRFKTYEEFSQWFLRMGGNPPPVDQISEYFTLCGNEQEAPDQSPIEPQSPPPKASKVKVGMKNTKVQLLELAAANDVVVSYYDTKTKILQKMKRSGKFTISSFKKG